MPHDYYFLYILQNGNIKQQNETTACKYKKKVTKQINWKKALIWYDLQMNINTCIIDIDKGFTTVLPMYSYKYCKTLWKGVPHCIIRKSSDCTLKFTLNENK